MGTSSYPTTTELRWRTIPLNAKKVKRHMKYNGIGNGIHDVILQDSFRLYFFNSLEYVTRRTLILENQKKKKKKIQISQNVD